MLTSSIQINHRLRSVVKNSILAEYILELNACGLVECSITAPTMEKLRLLRDYEQRRRRLKFRKVRTLGPPRPGELNQNCSIGFGGLLVHSSEWPTQGKTEVKFSHLQSHTCLYPPPATTHIFDISFNDYSFDEPSELLMFWRVADG